MCEQLYVLKLTDEQAEELRGYIQDKGWSGELELFSWYRAKEEVANEYINLPHGENGRCSPQVEGKPNV